MQIIEKSNKSVPDTFKVFMAAQAIGNGYVDQWLDVTGVACQVGKGSTDYFKVAKSVMNKMVKDKLMTRDHTGLYKLVAV